MSLSHAPRHHTIVEINVDNVTSFSERCTSKLLLANSERPNLPPKRVASNRNVDAQNDVPQAELQLYVSSCQAVQHLRELEIHMVKDRGNTLTTFGSVEPLETSRSGSPSFTEGHAG